MKSDRAVVIVWWLWVVLALLALPVPIRWAFALCTRGLDSVRSTGMAGGFALLDVSLLLTLFTFPLLTILSPFYGFLLWHRRRRGVRLAARFWVPIYGSAALAAMLGLMVFSMRVDRIAPP